MDETYFKSSIIQYNTMPEYIAVREQHYDMSRVDTATRNRVEQDELSITKGYILLCSAGDLYACDLQRVEQHRDVRLA